MVIRLISRKFSKRRSSKKLSNSTGSDTSSVVSSSAGGCGGIKWELRPGGMLVQKRDDGGSSSSGGEEMIKVRVSTGSRWHEISIEATSTFAELKTVLSMVTGLEPREQRLLFKGKEREDADYLHMVGVRDMDKVLLLEDPAMKEMKLLHAARDQPIVGLYTIKV